MAFKRVRRFLERPVLRAQRVSRALQGLPVSHRGTYSHRNVPELEARLNRPHWHAPTYREQQVISKLALADLSRVHHRDATKVVLDFTKRKIHDKEWTGDCARALEQTKHPDAIEIFRTYLNNDQSAKAIVNVLLMGTEGRDDVIHALVSFRTRDAYQALFDGLNEGYRLYNRVPHVISIVKQSSPTESVLPAMATSLPRHKSAWKHMLFRTFDGWYREFRQNAQSFNHPDVVALHRLWRHLKRHDDGRLDETPDFAAHVALQAYRHARDRKLDDFRTSKLFVQQLRASQLANTAK